VLQDIDIITPSTESTSILSDSSLVGIKKTRAMAAWADRRGFDTTMYERSFDASFQRTEQEPPIALCGLDNALGRQALDQVGFRFVVEAGLGRGHADFRNIRMHTLPSNRPGKDIWKTLAERSEDASGRPAYDQLLREGALDRCGITLLAGKAVGAPFVGSVAACLVVSEVLRLLHGGPLCRLVDLDLGSPDHRTVVPRDADQTTLNPGFIAAA
jgi:hypothetical protein